MPALVVASEEEEGVGVVDLQSPQEQYTLQRDTQQSLTSTLLDILIMSVL